MKFSPFLAIWLGLGAVFLGLLTTFISLWVSQRKKTADHRKQPSATGPGQDQLPQ